MNYNEKVFYGVDFKNINLYVKISLENVLELKKYYENPDLVIHADKYYEVYSVHLLDGYVRIKIYNKKYNVYPMISVNYDLVQFAYYFDKTKVEELNVVQM